MPLAFLIGAPRSGTTLLRVMLAGHPGLFAPPEMVIAPFPTMAARRASLEQRFWEKGGLRRAIMELEGVDVDAAKAREREMEALTVPQVYQWLQERIGDRVLVDKCPHLVADPEALERVHRMWPDARWIWIVRHPGSVVRSIENMPMAEVMLQGYSGGTRDLWVHANRTVQRFLEGIPADRQATVRYEELVADPRPSLERVCQALGVPFHEATLDPYEGDRMREGPPGARAVGDPNMAGRGRIEPELATKWLEGFDPSSVGPETHALAREFGYDLGAMAPPPMAEVSRQFRALLDRVGALEQSIQVASDLDAVEGRRFLLRMLGASADLFVEQGDADRPSFHHAEGPTRKMFADCPDADYLRAPVRTGPGRAYRVWGRIPPGTPYVGVLLYGRGGRIGAHLRDVDLRPDAEGRFDLTVSTEPHPGVWLRADGDETAVMLRQYYTDRMRQPPIEAHVALVGGPTGAPSLDPGRLAADLSRAARNLDAVWKRTVEAHKRASTVALNRFLAIGGEQLFPTPDNTYLVCWYRIGADQRMTVRGRLPKARYFSLCLYNLWMESLDYDHARVCLNHEQMVTDAGGGYEVVLAHRDPGHPNWLDTTGHAAGYLLARALLAEGEIPLPTLEVRYEREVR